MNHLLLRISPCDLNSLYIKHFKYKIKMYCSKKSEFKITLLLVIIIVNTEYKKKQYNAV